MYECAGCDTDRHSIGCTADPAHHRACDELCDADRLRDVSVSGLLLALDGFRLDEPPLT